MAAKKIKPSEDSLKMSRAFCDMALDGKILFHQNSDYLGNIVDEFILKGSTQYIYIKLYSVKRNNSVNYRDSELAAIDDPSELAASLSNGEYSQFESIPITHPDGQRILKIYHYLCEIHSIRGTRIQFVKKQLLLPAPEEAPKIEYA